MNNILQYEFFQHALWAALLSSLICGIIGTYIVAKRLVFISGGITHASFGGIGIAYYFGFHPILGAAVFALLSAFGVEWLTKKNNVREDSAIGMFWSVGMAVGIIFIYLSSGYSPNLMSYLFGSILTVTNTDLQLIAGLGIIVVAFFLVFYRHILYISFDEDYARSRKIPVVTMNYILISMISLAIVLNIRVVGVILVISFLTIPQMTANLLTHDFKRIIFISVFLAVAGSVGGLFLSYFLNLPSGPAIICVFVTIFLLVRLCTFAYQKFKVRKAVQK